MTHDWHVWRWDGNADHLWIDVAELPRKEALAMAERIEQAGHSRAVAMPRGQVPVTIDPPSAVRKP